MPYFYRSNPNMIVLNGELDFDKTKTPKEILDRLRDIAENVGGIVTTKGLHHGGRIVVYPCYDAEYYMLHLYLDDPNDDTSPLRVTHITTWRQVQLLDLKETKDCSSCDERVGVQDSSPTYSK